MIGFIVLVLLIVLSSQLVCCLTPYFETVGIAVMFNIIECIWYVILFRNYIIIKKISKICIVLIAMKYFIKTDQLNFETKM